MELTPKQIVQELDRYIIGQAEAKKAVRSIMWNPALADRLMLGMSPVPV